MSIIAMIEVEENHIEALTLNYLTLALINNLWTWLALLTAALSFWKIRASKSDSILPPPRDRLPPKPDPTHHSSDLDAVTHPLPALLLAPPNGDVVCHDVDGLTKGKFTVYYYDDDADVERESDDEEPVTVTVTATDDGVRSEWWDRLLRFRVGEGENGWYTCQDLTALNGNVVRFWDAGFPSTDTASRRVNNVW